MTVRCRQQNRAFALILRDWIEARAPLLNPLPIERLLEVVVAPIARGIPVLLIVLDGLSHAVWRNLGKSLPQLGWTEIRRSDGTAPTTSLAIMPSDKYLSGELVLRTRHSGQSSHGAGGLCDTGEPCCERRAGKPPRLFHKADLGAGPELETAVRDALLDPHQRIVGVVHNAIDAQLYTVGSDRFELVSRGATANFGASSNCSRWWTCRRRHGRSRACCRRRNQSGPRWKRGSLACSGTRASRRNCSRRKQSFVPRGHAIDCRSLERENSLCIKARWVSWRREPSGSPGSDHSAGWQFHAVRVGCNTAGRAGWYTPPSGAFVNSQQVHDATVFSARRRAANPMQPELPELTAPPPAVPDAIRTPISGVAANSLSWIDQLITSETYAAQRRLAGRGAPSDDHVKTLLNALAARGGRLSQVGLAQALSMPAFRLNGIVNAARRVANLDQAQVLMIEGDNVVLNERVLRVQFGLEDGT